MGKLANSWALTKASLAVVRKDKELLWLPVLSLAATVASFLLVVGIGFSVPHLYFTAMDAQGNGGTFTPMGIAASAVLYFLLAFVQVFFAAAILAGAHERLSGGDPTVGSSVRAAWKRLGRLLAWSFVVATVNLLLQMLRERGGAAGKVGSAFGSLAWNLLTFFVLPVLLFEEVGVGAAFGRSGALFKKTWGETVLGTGGIGAVFALAFFLIVLLVMLPITFVQSPFIGLPLVGAGIAALAILVTLGIVVQGVYKAALYRFATTGQGGAGFTPQQLGGAFVPK